MASDLNCLPPPPALPKTTVVNRVFYIDVTGIHPNDVGDYMDSVKKSVNLADEECPAYKITELKNGGVWEDFFIPVRAPDSTTGIFKRFYNWLFGYEYKPLTRIELLKVEV